MAIGLATGFPPSNVSFNWNGRVWLPDERPCVFDGATLVVLLSLHGGSRNGAAPMTRLGRGVNRRNFSPAPAEAKHNSPPQTRRSDNLEVKSSIPDETYSRTRAKSFLQRTFARGAVNVFVVNRILDMRVSKRRGHEYLVHWDECRPDEATWEKEKDVLQSPDHLRQFHLLRKELKPGPLVTKLLAEASKRKARAKRTRPAPANLNRPQVGGEAVGSDGCVLSDNEATFAESGESEVELGASPMSSSFDADYEDENEGKQESEVQAWRPESEQAEVVQGINLQPQLGSSNSASAEGGRRQGSEVREDGQCFRHLDCLPANYEECLDDLTMAITQIHLASRPVARLPSYKRRNDNLKHIWSWKKTAFADTLRTGIDDFKAPGGKERTTLVNAVLGLMALPANALVPASNLIQASGRVRLERPGKPTVDVTIGEGVIKRKCVRPEPPPASGGHRQQWRGGTRMPSSRPNSFGREDARRQRKHYCPTE